MFKKLEEIGEDLLWTMTTIIVCLGLFFFLTYLVSTYGPSFLQGPSSWLANRVSGNAYSMGHSGVAPAQNVPTNSGLPTFHGQM